MLTSQYMHDFNEKTYDKEEMSREDMRFFGNCQSFFKASGWTLQSKNAFQERASHILKQSVYGQANVIGTQEEISER